MSVNYDLATWLVEVCSLKVISSDAENNHSPPNSGEMATFLAFKLSNVKLRQYTFLEWVDVDFS